MKTWQTYLLRRLLKTFFFFFGAIFFIYVIVDLSIHGVRFFSQEGAHSVFRYYLNTFATLFELFLSLSFLLAILRVLIDCNQRRELLALQMAGLSKKRFLLPFFLVAGGLSGLCYLNSQWVAPYAQETVDIFRSAHKTKKKKTPRLYSLSLEDDSELVYQHFDAEKRELFDVFWVRTPNDIWHMKYLEIESLHGRYVHHLIRNPEKQLEKQASFSTRSFPELPWNEEAILHRFVPFENRSLSTLFTQVAVLSSDRASVLSHLLYKMAMPLLPLLLLLTLAPTTLRFSRDQPTFLLVTCSLFGFIALKVVLDGMLILGENQVLSPLIALLAPIGLLIVFSFPSFRRMQ